MSDQFSNAQQVRKPAVVSKGGIIAAQSRKAAEIGAEVLAAGGDCVDAVVAATFALGVCRSASAPRTHCVRAKRDSATTPKRHPIGFGRWGRTTN